MERTKHKIDIWLHGEDSKVITLSVTHEQLLFLKRLERIFEKAGSPYSPDFQIGETSMWKGKVKYGKD